ncbi:MAG: universal stress protein [Opitutaceae bacterium]
MKTILTPVDFSAITETVVAAAAVLARDQKARLVLINITQLPLIASEYAPYMENVAEAVTVSERAAAKHLDRFAQRLKADGLVTDTLQVTGDPVSYILKQAAELEADYIVMGSHGHTAMYDLLVGSTTHRVLLKAACPVLVVPASRKKSARPKK